MHRRDALKTSAVGAIALASLDGNALRTFAKETPKTLSLYIRIDKDRIWEISYHEKSKYMKIYFHQDVNGTLTVFDGAEKEKFTPSGYEYPPLAEAFSCREHFLTCFVQRPHYSLKIVTK